MQKKIIIAIDGHSSCGKSTMAKDLARKIDYIYIDTGAMYRAVTLYALRNQLFRTDGCINEEALKQAMDDVKITFKLNETTHRPDTYLNDECVENDIRTLEVSSHVSAVAALPFVRSTMVLQQQAMGREKGIVMDGRDIGTAVFPQAELKIFVTASEEVRAQRRYKELQSKGMPADFQEVLDNIKKRDYMDSHREVSPLRKADDALLLDNSHLSIEEQTQWLLERYNEAVQRA